MKITFKFLKYLIVSLCILSLLSCKQNSDKKQELDKPNIILCMSDDQGWGDIEYNNHPILKTPNLNEMAKNGLTLNRFYAASPVCSPTRVNVLTGRHGNRMGCFSYGYYLKPEEITLAQLLKEKGYRTAHFGKWHIGPIQKESPINPGNSGFDYWLSSVNFFDLDPLFSRNGKIERIKGEGSNIIVDEALKFIKESEKANAPYFIVIWFASPHTPHLPNKKHRRKYLKVQEDHKNFYAEISAMDEAIGKLRKGIRDYSNAENTLLWFNGDNGGLDYYGRTGGRSGKGSIYEGGLLVPSIVEWPQVIDEKIVSKQPCSTNDIFPTIAEACNLEIPKRPIDGISLIPFFNDPNLKRPDPIYFWKYKMIGRRLGEDQLMDSIYVFQENNLVAPMDFEILNSKKFKPDSLLLGVGHSAILDWPWKLHKRKEKNGPVTFELFNLHTDPYERGNLINVNRRIANRLKKKLRAWQSSVADSYQGKDY